MSNQKSIDVLNLLSHLLNLPEDCCGIDLRIRIDSVPQLTVHRKVKHGEIAGVFMDLSHHYTLAAFDPEDV